MSNLKTDYNFKLDFQSGPTYRRQAVNQRHQTTHGSISCKAWNSPVEYPSREYKHDIKESEGILFNPKFKENVQAPNIQKGVYLQNQNYLVTESPNI